METCKLTGERFPEYDQWLAEATAEKQAHQKKVEELKDDPRRLMLYALEKLTGKKASELPSAIPQALANSRPTLLPSTGSRQKIGRNDPCPCGSGKKFKKCCMQT